MEDVYFTGILPISLNPPITRQNIGGLFPWRPKQWQNSFIEKDLMILELDKRLGKNSSEKFWKLILEKEGNI